MQIKTKQKCISCPDDAGQLLMAILKVEEPNDQDKEHFWAIGLNTRNLIQYVELVSLGTLTTNIVHPREIFRLAIQKGVVGIIIGHNHPSGSITPSGEDLAITQQLTEAGKILDIEVIDHIIITKTQTFSFKRGNLM